MVNKHQHIEINTVDVWHQILQRPFSNPEWSFKLIRKRPLQRNDATLRTNKTSRPDRLTINSTLSHNRKEIKLLANVKNSYFTRRACVEEWSSLAGGCARVHLFSLLSVPPTRARRAGTAARIRRHWGQQVKHGTMTEIYNNRMAVKDISHFKWSTYRKHFTQLKTEHFRSVSTILVYNTRDAETGLKCSVALKRHHRRSGSQSLKLVYLLHINILIFFH